MVNCPFCGAERIMYKSRIVYNTYIWKATYKCNTRLFKNPDNVIAFRKFPCTNTFKIETIKDNNDN